MRFLVLAALMAAAFAAEPAARNPLVGRTGDTGFIQLEAPSFNELTPKQKEVAYWLSQASIAIDRIIYDQLSEYGLRQKRVLEMIVAHSEAVPSAQYGKILEFTKLFWANRGNHNETTAQKFLPDFTFDDLKSAGLAVIHAGKARGFIADSYTREIEALRPSLFDAGFQPMTTAKAPRNGQDILQASSNTFYSEVTAADLLHFHGQYPLNSRLVKRNGRLTEEVYRAGTPDGSVPPGLYADYLRKANSFLERAAAAADASQAKAIRDLIRYYQTGDPKEWLQFGADWVRDNGPVDFSNGFIEVYRDPRGAKGASESFTVVTDQPLTRTMLKLASNAQYFENKAPWAPQYRRTSGTMPVVKAVEALVETGDFHVTTIGDNLPNENEIHEKYGTKNFLFTASSHAITRAAGWGALREFAASPQEIAICEKYGEQAEDLMTAMHEVIGHGSGKLNPKLTREPSYYLKEYFSTLEEARADLMALWNVWDPKLKQLGLVQNQDDVAKAMYYDAARVALTQLRRIPRGNTIEEDHQRDRQLIAHYIMDKTGAIAYETRGGKTYVAVRDFAKMRKGAGMLLAELMRIKGEGDYNAIKALVDKYGVHFDPKIRDQVVARYKKLNIPTYWAGINADLTANFGTHNEVTGVTISYPRDFVKQQLAYSAMYAPQPRRFHIPERPHRR